MMKIERAKIVAGEIKIPGDKSVSHRAAMLLSIADGAAAVTNFSPSADCASTVECMRGLGVKIEGGTRKIIVYGAGRDGLTPPNAVLDCGNSGTTMRLLCGLLAGQPFASTLAGDESLSRRPMGRIIEPLGAMGCTIDSDGGRAPLRVRGSRPLASGRIVPQAASAQIKSAILLAGLYADGETAVIEKTPTRDHTERMLGWLGADVSVAAGGDGSSAVTIVGGQNLKARDIVIPADISAAAFFMVAAAALRGSYILMRNVGINGGRRSIIDLLAKLGADIEVSGVADVCNEPTADIRVRGNLRPAAAGANRIGGAAVAGLIDEIPVLAVFGTQIEGGLEVRDARELRLKESDRITATVENLRRMQASVEEFDDGFRVERSTLRGAVIEPAGDHRIAMAFAVAGLFASGETIVENAECCAVSFPDFFRELQAATTPSAAAL